MQKSYNSTAYREELRSQTLVVAMSLFKKNGIKSVKMDDIAAELGISKRTLYELYSNKEDLLYECVRNDKLSHMADMGEYAKTAVNEMDIMVHFFNTQLSDLGSTNPAFFADILKYPKTQEYLRSVRMSQKKNSKDFIKRGVDNGFFNADIDYEILDKLADAAMNHVMQSRMYRFHSFRDICRTFMLIFMRTCCTEKGQQYMQGLLDN